MSERPPATWVAIIALLVTALNGVPAVLRGLGMSEGRVIGGTWGSLAIFLVALAYLMYRLFVDFRAASLALCSNCMLRLPADFVESIPTGGLGGEKAVLYCMHCQRPDVPYPNGYGPDPQG